MKLQVGGYETEKIHIQASIHTEATRTKMLNLTSSSDLIILAFPLYADSLPAPVIAALEMIAQQRQNTAQPASQRFLTIVNNGFPEAHQNAIAVQICRRFCVEAGLDWAGGLSLGGGGAIDGASLEKAGFVSKNARKSLDLAANDLLAGSAISKTATDLMAKSPIPKWLFLWMANRGWKKQAKVCRAESKLYNKLE
jgi:hypothetical protein